MNSVVPNRDKRLSRDAGVEAKRDVCHKAISSASST